MPVVQEWDPQYYSPQYPTEATPQPAYENGWLNDVGTYLSRSAASLGRIPGDVGRMVALPWLQQQEKLYTTDWSKQPFIDVNRETGELTGRAPALASLVTPYITGGGPGTVTAGIRLPSGHEGAYHGTPHTFPSTARNQLGEFSDLSIGTGEGAAAYGRGHYLGESRGTAESYMDLQSPYKEFKFNDQPIDWGNLDPVSRYALDTVQRQGGVDAAISRMKRELHDFRSPAVKDDIYNSIDWLETNADRLSLDPSRLYHVEIKPPNEAFLDLDKAIREQSPEVQRTVRQAAEALPEPDFIKNRGEDAQQLLWRREKLLDLESTGRDVYDTLARGSGAFHSNKEFATNVLRDLGVPGNRYLDQFSRDVSPGVYYTGSKEVPKHVKQWGMISSTPTQLLESADRQITALRDVTDKAANLYAKAPILGRVPGTSINVGANRSLLMDLMEAREFIRKNLIDFNYQDPRTYNYVAFDPRHLNIVGRE